MMKKLAFQLGLLLGFSLLIFAIFKVQELPQETKPATSSTKVASKKKTTKSKPKTKVKAIAKTIAAVNEPTIDSYLRTQNFSGTALVAQHGKVIFHQAYGWNNSDRKNANQLQTPYLIGSSQKSLIATAVLQLDQQHKLNIDDPLAKYLPKFPKGDQIKLRNLLNHTSGITGRSQTTGTINHQKIVQEIEQRGCNGKLGTWNYLDSNYTLLAYIVEQISHESLAHYLQEHIFKPAQIFNSGLMEVKKPQTPMGDYKIRNDGSILHITLPDLSQLFGAGDIYMTASDFYRYDQALMHGKLINQVQLQKMFTSGSTSKYGMGFYVNPGSYASHGVLGGYNTLNTFTHDGKTTIILLANTNQAQIGLTGEHIYRLLNSNQNTDIQRFGH
ncbi:beta-lactamase family protein [Lactobacillus sp. DCY120]|uniref:Beta-lactamase family protein n=1 Tax=Bombilactobacillus apium TaxID=2675299 RepID=A0A850R6A8_9LACO|nr:serine hydrolase domain-containing protein [Bombilactobacillus apium]NVY96075.1 beta-lactamase family protein [Bombilactobacillus apium]